MRICLAMLSDKRFLATEYHNYHKTAERIQLAMHTAQPWCTVLVRQLHRTTQHQALVLVCKSFGSSHCPSYRWCHPAAWPRHKTPLSCLPPRTSRGRCSCCCAAGNQLGQCSCLPPEQVPRPRTATGCHWSFSAATAALEECNLRPQACAHVSWLQLAEGLVLLWGPKGMVPLHLLDCHCCQRPAQGQELALDQTQGPILGQAQALVLVHCYQAAHCQVPTVLEPQALQPAHQLELGSGPRVAAEMVMLVVKVMDCHCHEAGRRRAQRPGRRPGQPQQLAASLWFCG